MGSSQLYTHAHGRRHDRPGRLPIILCTAHAEARMQEFSEPRKRDQSSLVSELKLQGTSVASIFLEITRALSYIVMNLQSKSKLLT